MPSVFRQPLSFFSYRLLFVFGSRQRIADIFGLSESDHECENVGEKPQSESKACPVPKGLCDTEARVQRPKTTLMAI